MRDEKKGSKLGKGVTGRRKSEMSDRVERVVLDGAVSNEVTVTSGVPQGSVIGPHLFLLYINDIGGIVHSKLLLFADDALV